MIRKEKYNWIQDDIELDFIPNKALQGLMKEAEEFDLAGDAIGYFTTAEGIDVYAKASYSRGQITQKQWDDICDKYPGEERF